MPKLRISCWTRSSGTITVNVNPTELKSYEQEWLKWFAEQKVQEEHGVKIHPLRVEVTD